MTSTTITALVQKGGKLHKDDVPIPRPDENQVLVKVSHVAQNPTDGKPSIYMQNVYVASDL